MGKGDRDDEFGTSSIGLTTGKDEKGMGKYAFGSWSVLLAIVFLSIGIAIGTFVDSSSLPFGISSGSEVENVDLTNEITEGGRRMMLEAHPLGGHVERHLLNHNTAYYDTISQLTVVKENGWTYSFNTASYHIKKDNGLVFYGINGEELEFPGDGSTTSDWKLTGVVESVAMDTFELPFGRRLTTEVETSLRATERENVSFEGQGHRALSASTKLCDKNHASDCKTCIETQDAWCSTNNWDSSCIAGCDGPTKYMAKGCKEECAEPPVVSVKAKKTKEVDKKTPIDCVVGDWAAVTGSCSVKAGSAACYEKETRSILTQPQHGGDQCPSEGNERLVECVCEPVCGDGFLMPGEECDDGNAKDKDGCDHNCIIETGWLCTKEPFGLSECTNGKCECSEWGQGVCQQGTCLPVKGSSLTIDCVSDAQCQLSKCGDGIQTGVEQCDDGNTKSGDGCSATCGIELYHSCTGGVGQKTECTKMRVRKDFRDLTAEEKSLYIEAVNVLKAQGVYDLIVQTHAHLTNKDYAHGSSGFLPWHRKYLLEYENALRSADPNGKYKDVTVPYWDWAEDTDLCSANGGCKTYDEKGAIFDSNTGMGGPGSFACSSHPHGGTIDCDDLPKDATGADIAAYKAECTSGKSFTNPNSGETSTLSACSGDVTWGSTGAKGITCSQTEMDEDGCKPIPDNAVGCVRDGPFAGWMSPEYPENKDNTKTCLSRGLNWFIDSQGYLTGSQRLTQIITQQKEYGSNGGFRAYIESTPHANPHNLLGGHIRSFSSPADPLFFSHHAFIDKVWSMWQNCHDHDETDKEKVSSKEYRGTQNGWDDYNTDLVFFFPGESSGEDKCDGGIAGACKTCVEGKDSWCGSNTWDQTCKNFCTGGCATECGAAGEVRPGTKLKPVAAGVNCPSCTQSYYQFDDTRLKPKFFHSIHDLGYELNADGSENLNKPQSYLYAPDQFDIKMKEQKAICDWTETKHHGKQWKQDSRRLAHDNNRQAKPVPKGFKHDGSNRPDDHIPLDENGRPVEMHSHRARKLYELHGQKTPSRLLAAVDDGTGANNEFCPYDSTGEWSSSYNIWRNDDGDLMIDMEYYYDDQGHLMERAACYCDDGKVWDLDHVTCVSIMPDDSVVFNSQDPDTKAILSYWYKLGNKLIEDSEFVKDEDSLQFSLDEMTQRECKLLYNEKSKIVRADDVKDGTGASAPDFTDKNGHSVGPGSRAKFLEGWGLAPCVGDNEKKCIQVGLADDPCDTSV
ncbi:hypothetical protein TrCOL_g13795 [Triparma columacea]|uniref:Tyrosinase copper-binding domain-containing protein n=1 Tax=Triparma columacea TaxID=722753 RepID=A0A9W7LDG9_9STRA|nr:hypothetical protein TrCOL_g13795 [Triparma columacea]